MINMAKKEEKTNVMRILDQKKIPYEQYSYDSSKSKMKDIARSRGMDLSMIFKTLVTVGKSKQYYVFMVPVEQELDLKKGAKLAGEKSIEMIPQKELQPLTGYIHGGCSPIGMKKQFPTFIDSTAEQFDAIYFSAGRVGHQVRLALSDLQQVINVKVGEITKE